MELSPKQQTVELVKKAERILILGHQEPSGDFLGSALATTESLRSLGKKVELICSAEIPSIYSFLPFLQNIKNTYQHTAGKIIRIDTNKIPVKAMKWQRLEDSLDLILETDKNLKFEFMEIINGEPKPDLILILNTPDVEKIDTIYDANTELFFEVPIINIDHHPGNEYFGTVNLVDLTATSTAEILVSLFEALGIKIDNADVATCLLTGLISETQSFRTQSTTPKSLTVAAQLLASGAHQQEIVSNLYKKRPMALLKLWGDMLSGISEDKAHRMAWTTVTLSNVADGISETDVFDAADELLSNTPDADVILILCEKEKGLVIGKLKAARGKNVLELAKLFGGDGVATNAFFRIKDKTLSETELFVLKKIYDYWTKNGELSGTKEVWDLIEKENEIEKEMVATPKPTEKKIIDAEIEREMTENPSQDTILANEKEIEREMVKTPPLKEDTKKTKTTQNSNQDTKIMASNHEKIKNLNVIDKALHSIELEEKSGSFSSIGDVLAKKQKDLGHSRNELEPDVFDETEI